MAGAARERQVTVLRAVGMPIVDYISTWYWWQRLIVPAVRSDRIGGQGCPLDSAPLIQFSSN